MGVVRETTISQSQCKDGMAYTNLIYTKICIHTYRDTDTVLWGKACFNCWSECKGLPDFHEGFAFRMTIKYVEWYQIVC